MWANAANGWQGRGPGDQTCFGDGDDARRFFDETATGMHCNRNWLEGTHEWPVYSVDAPALLGFGGGSMLEYCLQVLGQKPRHVWWANSQEIADACVRAQKNILRLKSGWSMCKNLEWQVCAAKGLLHGQGKHTRAITFAPAPNTLRIDDNPSPARKGGSGVAIVENDVFYLEVCIFSQICEQGSSIFGLEEGKDWQCDIDQTRFDELQRMLQGLPVSENALSSPPSPLPLPGAAPLGRTSSEGGGGVASSASIVTMLNARWLAGRPSNDLEEGGVIMWVVDGDGKRLNGMNAVDPWLPIPDSPTGDRHSASLVSKRHPYVFACFACEPDFRHNPGFVLAPSAATRARLMCAIHSDIGTVRFKCNPLGRSDMCRPGCGGAICGRNPPWKTWQCSWALEDLKRMMETHDGLGMGYGGPLTTEQKYNELLFASLGADAWERDLKEMVQAVFVQSASTNQARENGRQLQRSVLQHTGAVANAIPLVEYDPSRDSDPFRLLEP